MTLRTAGIQMEVSSDVERNADKICAAIRQAASEGANILLTPEGSLSGYRPDFDPAAVSDALSRVTALAHQHQIGLALGTCFKESNGLVYNQLRFYTPDGRYLGFHSKILRCGSMTDHPEGEINDYATTELTVFPYGGYLIGGLICNDLWANPSCTPMPDPHLSQQLAQKGAGVIFHAVNGGRDGSGWAKNVVWPFHESNLRQRARAGKVWIVTVDNCGPLMIPCSAPSGVLDPQGNWVCRAQPQGEHLFTHTIDFE